MKEMPGEPVFPVEYGCSDPQKNDYNVDMSRQSKLLTIHKEDVISDNGNEIVNYLKLNGITTVFYVGVHANVCILSRPFGMRNLKVRGFDVILIRDLTDSYIVKSKKGNHRQCHDLIINHIETYIAPTIESGQL